MAGLGGGEFDPLVFGTVVRSGKPGVDCKVEVNLVGGEVCLEVVVKEQVAFMLFLDVGEAQNLAVLLQEAPEAEE